MRRLVASIVAGAMVIAVVPIGTMTAMAAPVSVAKAAPVFSKLRGQGLDANLVNAGLRPDRANVRWRTGVSPATVRAFAQRLGFTVVTNGRLGWSQVTPGPGTTSGALVEALRGAGLVAAASPTVWMQKADTTPNDPLFPSQWALKNTGQDGGTAGNDVNVGPVWSRSTGSKDVIVAVVDEGLNWAHADLKNNMWINTAEVPNNHIDDDNDGFVDDVRGWDFANHDNTVYDASDGDRHGTHVAGIIGAQGNNNIGITGVNQSVRIMPVKFLGPDGGSDYDGASAIVYAVDHGASVINCSWGGWGISDVLQEAIDYAASRDVVIVCAAGNSASDNDAEDAGFYPASSESTNVISVAASDRNGAMADFSDYGAESVDLAAPGVDVTSTLPVADAAISVDGMTWKTVFVPLQAEIMQPASARDALIARSVSQLGEPADTPILVVDDSAASVTSETPGVRLKIYTDALAAAGFPSVTTWVTDTKGTPTLSAMSGKTVVWFTGKDTAGYYGDSCINSDEEDAIRADLDAGGRMVLISGKAASDLAWFGSDPMDPEDDSGSDMGLIEEYFGAKCVDYETWTRDFHGRASTAFAGIDALIPLEYTDPEAPGNLWPTASDAIVRVPAGFSSTAVVYTGAYGPLSGTSMAAPHVTGAIALLKACLPSADGEELAARVVNTASPRADFKGRTASGGVLDVAAAFGEYPGRVSITSPKRGDRLHTGAHANVSWKAAAGSSPAATFTVQVGLPYAAYTNGFESGNLNGFVEVTSTATPWQISTEATAARTGAYAAMSGPVPASTPATDMGPGWFETGMSAMQTTITVPSGGGRLSFYWRMPEGDGWDVVGAVFGPTDGTYLFPGDDAAPGDWVQASLWLPEGEQPVEWATLNSARTPSDIRMYVDDIELTAHAFTDIGEAPAGSTSLGFTVPSMATDDAYFRVTAHLNGVDSAPATVRGVQLISDSVAPGTVTSLTLTPDNDGNVAIAWANPTDADYAETLVLASADHAPTGPDDASATVAYEGTGTAGSFGPVTDGTAVHVSAWTADTSGNWSSAAASQTLAVDKTPPAAPRSLRSLDLMPGLPALNWAGADVAGEASATVLRSYESTPSVNDPDAMLVDSWPGFAIDERLDPDATQAFYTVYLTDPSGNVSQPSSIRVTIDPTGVSGDISIEATAQTDSAAIVESTTVTVLADVTNATEMRTWINDEGDPDADWQPFQSEFTVELLPIQGPQTVHVEFRSGPEGQPVELTADAILLLHDPVAPTGLSAEGRNTGVKLAWDVPEDPSIAGYRVFESISPLGPWNPLVDPEGVPMDGSWFLTGPLAPGLPHYFKVTALDVLGREGAGSAIASSMAGIGVVRYKASTPAGIAAAASAARFAPFPGDPLMGDAVVIASVSDYIQALAANSLAGSLNASVLLAGKSLPAETAAEITRLKVRKAYVVGTSGAIAPGVDTALKQLGLKVERVGGTDAYDVAARVARRVMAPAAVLPGVTEALVVNGTSKSDMCALMPVAYASHIPVFVVKLNSIPAPVRSLIGKVHVSGGAVIGGKLAVSDKVGRAVFGGPGYERVWGKRAVQTAVSLAAWSVEQGYCTWDHVSVTNPVAWTDSLAIGAATNGGVVLLTPAGLLDPSTVSSIRENALAIDTVAVFGGGRSVNSSVQSRLRAAMSAPSGVVANPDEPFPPFPPDGM